MVQKVPEVPFFLYICNIFENMTSLYNISLQYIHHFGLIYRTLHDYVTLVKKFIPN
jgi:hypothetical protein